MKLKVYSILMAHSKERATRRQYGGLLRTGQYVLNLLAFGGMLICSLFTLAPALWAHEHAPPSGMGYLAGFGTSLLLILGLLGCCVLALVRFARRGLIVVEPILYLPGLLGSLALWIACLTGG